MPLNNEMEEGREATHPSMWTCWKMTSRVSKVCHTWILCIQILKTVQGKTVRGINLFGKLTHRYKLMRYLGITR